MTDQAEDIHPHPNTHTHTPAHPHAHTHTHTHTHGQPRRGGLVHHDPGQVVVTAKACLALWEQGGRGCLHAQSQRWLSPDWKGLRGDGEEDHLRVFVEVLAAGASSMREHASSERAYAHFLKWLSGLRLASLLQEQLLRLPATTIE